MGPGPMDGGLANEVSSICFFKPGAEGSGPRTSGTRVKECLEYTFFLLAV